MEPESETIIEETAQLDCILRPSEVNRINRGGAKAKIYTKEEKDIIMKAYMRAKMSTVQTVKDLKATHPELEASKFRITRLLKFTKIRYSFEYDEEI